MLRLLIAALFLLMVAPAVLAQTLAISSARLPNAVEGRLYYQQFEARGGEPPYQWKVVAGAPPAGITLDSAGLLTGIPRQTGEFAFTVEVTDSSRPARSARREFLLRIPSVLSMIWSPIAAVANGGIAGGLTVTNGTHESFDLTVIVLAVAENGRATALGYQHFNMRPGEQQIPFASTLPQGSYVVHADAVAEFPRTGAIRRVRLQSPPLTIP